MRERDDELDLVWGVRAIGAEINRNERQTYQLIEAKRLPAIKVGGKWCASRKGLREYFKRAVRGELAEPQAA